MKKITSIEEYRRWAKMRMGYLELTQAELARRMHVPRERINESLHGKPSGRKYVLPVIRELGGREEDFEELLRAL